MKLFFYILIPIILLQCKPNEQKTASDVILEAPEKIILNQEKALFLSKLPLKCINIEYPNKLNQSLSSRQEMGGPAQLHPAFYGCYDWHSSVHGHWLLVHLLRKYPSIENRDTIIESLQKSITSNNILTELEYFKRDSEKSFERPYGWAWLLKLQLELDMWDDENAKQMSQALQPLSDFIISKYLEFLPKLVYPVRGGEHSNTAFGLSLAYDYALYHNHEGLKILIEETAKRHYMNDVDCPFTWEPSGFDFLSPCLQEAELVSKILPKEEFKTWFEKFMPSLLNPEISIAPATVSDRSDGKLVHLDGVNFCRAWSLYRIGNILSNRPHLINIANQHIEASLPNIVDGDYAGEHWLASFAVLALNHQ